MNKLLTKITTVVFNIGVIFSSLLTTVNAAGGVDPYNPHIPVDSGFVDSSFGEVAIIGGILYITGTGLLAYVQKLRGLIKTSH